MRRARSVVAVAFAITLAGCTDGPSPPATVHAAATPEQSVSSPKTSDDGINLNAFIVIGLQGDETCGTWTAHAAELRSASVTLNQHGAETIKLKYWLYGFVTGVSYEGGMMVNTNGPALVEWVTNYCAQNPLDQIQLAIPRLIAELKRRAR